MENPRKSSVGQASDIEVASVATQRRSSCNSKWVRAGWMMNFAAISSLFISSALADTVFVNTGDPDGKMATASRPGTGGSLEIESADDFILNQSSTLTEATFTGLLPSGASLSSVQEVVVEIYRVFPNDSNNPPDNHVPTRVNSPSDVALVSRDSAVSELTFTTDLISTTFTANNSVLNGIHQAPNQHTGGDGSVTGQEVRFEVKFTTPISLAPDHYFFIPQVKLSNGDFFWLSAPKPITSPGTPFTPDLQSWIRNGDLDPDWLRIGTDIVGGTPAPTFNASFSLSGTVPDVGSSVTLLSGAFAAILALRKTLSARQKI